MRQRQNYQIYWPGMCTDHSVWHIASELFSNFVTFMFHESNKTGERDWKKMEAASIHTMTKRQRKDRISTTSLTHLTGKWHQTGDDLATPGHSISSPWKSGSAWGKALLTAPSHWAGMLRKESVCVGREQHMEVRTITAVFQKDIHPQLYRYFFIWAVVTLKCVHCTK